MFVFLYHYLLLMGGLISSNPAGLVIFEAAAQW